MTYAEQLKHPFWQKKRLEIFQRDNFTCIDCGNQDKQLHVHHGYYEPKANNLMAWEYESDTLHTLCQDCHEKNEKIKNEIYKEVAKLPIVEHPSIYFDLVDFIKSKKVNK